MYIPRTMDTLKGPLYCFKTGECTFWPQIGGTDCSLPDCSLPDCNLPPKSNESA